MKRAESVFRMMLAGSAASRMMKSATLVITKIIITARHICRKLIRAFLTFQLNGGPLSPNAALTTGSRLGNRLHGWRTMKRVVFRRLRASVATVPAAQKATRTSTR